MYSQVAQSVERRTLEEEVRGSEPVLGTWWWGRIPPNQPYPKGAAPAATTLVEEWWPSVADMIKPQIDKAEKLILVVWHVGRVGNHAQNSGCHAHKRTENNCNDGRNLATDKGHNLRVMVHGGFNNVLIISPTYLTSTPHTDMRKQQKREKDTNAWVKKSYIEIDNHTLLFDKWGCFFFG